MESENDIVYKLAITNEFGEKSKIEFTRSMLKYFPTIANAIEDTDEKESEQIPEYGLEASVWQFILEVYAEHDKTNAQGVDPLKQRIRNTKLTLTIEGIPINEMYSVLRVMDYYLSPLMVMFVANNIAKRLLAIPLNKLVLSHAKVRLPLIDEVKALVIQLRSDRFFTSYKIRLYLLNLILQRYVRTNELVKQIEERFPQPGARYIAAGPDFIMFITERGLYSHGADNKRCLTKRQIADRVKEVEAMKQEEVNLQRIGDMKNAQYIQLNSQTQFGAAFAMPYQQRATLTREISSIFQSLVDLGTKLGKQLDSYDPVIDMQGEEVINFACGVAHTLVLTNKGLFSCGSNAQGQIGIGANTGNDVISRFQRVELSITENILLVTCGDFSSCASTGYDTYVWGKAYNGTVLDVNLIVPFLHTPIRLPIRGRTTSVALMGTQTFLIVEGKLVIINAYGVVRGTGPEQLLSLASSNSHVILLDNNGVVYGYGANAKGQIGRPDLNRFDHATKPIPSLENQKFTRIFAGYSCSFFLKEDNTLYAIGDNTNFRLGHDGPVTTIVPTAVFHRYQTLDIGVTTDKIYFFTTGGLFTYRGNGLWFNEDIALLQQQLPPQQLPGFTPLIVINDDDTPTQQSKKPRISCYYCGNSQKDLLTLHNKSERIFCATDCHSNYTNFTI